MRTLPRILLGSLFLTLPGCQSAPNRGASMDTEMPMARIEPTRLEKHGHVRVDDYYWLRKREDPRVIAYLEAENRYTHAVMAHTEGREEALFREIKGRIQQTDSSVPYRRDDHFYYTRFEDGKEYAIHCRKRGSVSAAEEVLLDVNELARGHEYFNVGRRAVSSGQDVLAYAVDTAGRRIYTIRFKNLATGEVLQDTLPEVTGNMAWANDNRTFFYARQDPTTLRSHRIYRHVLGSDSSRDPLVYEEQDDTFSCYVFQTKSRKYLLIGSFQTLSSEYRFLDAGTPDGKFEVFWPRERKHEYDIDHFGDHFYIRSNFQAKNFRLMRTPVTRTAREEWEEVIPHRDDVLLEGIEVFRDHLVVVEREGGLIQLRVRPWSGADEHYLEFEEPAYVAYPTNNHELDTEVLRFHYSSMTTPDSTFDHDMVSREKVLLKQKEVLGDFDARSYRTERLHARAKDGTEVPISVVYRRGIARDGSHPLLLYGYGSYGHSLDASFRSERLSLLDRGLIYAIAHVRGGEELGRHWYDDGKLMKKKNTFTDFIACAEHLVKANYTRKDRLFAMGGSAGGLLMGAVINMRPDLFKGVIASVPFVDVVTTMLDDDIPLTTSEYDEWGNPGDKSSYDYILSYSPYDNVEAKDYPHLLVVTSLHDSQVQYWEPAKWVARLRALKTDDNRLLLKTYMAAGHGGVSGRYKRYRETAFLYAFLLDLAGRGK